MIITTIESIEQPLDGATSISVKVSDGSISVKVQMLITRDAANRLVKAIEAVKRTADFMDESTPHELLSCHCPDFDPCGSDSGRLERMELVQDD